MAERDGDLLRLEDLRKSFSLRQGLSWSQLMAVDGAAFAISSERHEIFALAGESGSGKTTLARIVLGLTEPTSGRISFQGRDVSRLGGGERRRWFRRLVQPVFQDPYATFSPLRRVDSYLYETASRFGAGKVNARVGEALDVVGLSPGDLAGRHPHEMSGGQLQRIAIARALISGPALLVADEPVSMLDASLRMSILNLFKRLKDRQSVLYITHDLATVYYVADRVAIMLRGWIVELGPVEQVLGEPLHPYTRALKDSILEADPGRRADKVPPVAASAEAPAAGCKYADRCPLRMEICTRVAPKDVMVDGRLVKCHLYGPKAA